MAKTSIEKINIKNILDVMYEPDKDQYSVLEYNSIRKEITRKDFHTLLYSYLERRH